MSTSGTLGSAPVRLKLTDLIAAMHSAKRLDPQSCLERPDLDRAIRLLRLPYPNWHQAWHGLVMKRITKWLSILVLLCGCAETRLYDRDHLAAVIQGDATNVTFKSGVVYFHADVLNHSTPTIAAGVAVSKVSGIVGSVVTTGITGNAASLIPAAISAVPTLKP